MIRYKLVQVHAVLHNWIVHIFLSLTKAACLTIAGTRVPSLFNLQALRFASNAMNSSITLIADALGNVTLTQNVGYAAEG